MICLIMLFSSCNKIDQKEYDELMNRYESLKNDYERLEVDYLHMHNQYSELLNVHNELKNDYRYLGSAYDDIWFYYNLLDCKYMILPYYSHSQ